MYGLGKTLLPALMLAGASVAASAQQKACEIDEGSPNQVARAYLDIQTALCLMNIPFAVCLTPAEYRRAVHSLRLDISLLSVLATVTGDGTFHSWRAQSLPVRVDSNVDVPAMVYEHALLCEYAHARLCQLRDAGAAASVAAEGLFQPPGAAG